MDAPKRTRDPEARIAAIRATAAEIIVDTGVDSLTHRAVAARAGVAVGTTTKYFSTIDTLRKAAVEVLIEQLNEDITEIEHILAASTEPGGDLVGGLAAAVWESLSDPRRVFTECSLSYSGLFDADLRELSVQWYQRLRQILSPYVGDAPAAVLTQLLDGMMLATALTGEIPSREHIAAAIAAVIAMDHPWDAAASDDAAESEN